MHAVLTITIDRPPAHSHRHSTNFLILRLLGPAASSGKTPDVELEAADWPLRGAQPLAEALRTRAQDL